MFQPPDCHCDDYKLEAKETLPDGRVRVLVRCVRCSKARLSTAEARDSIWDHGRGKWRLFADIEIGDHEAPKP